MAPDDETYCFDSSCVAFEVRFYQRGEGACGRVIGTLSVPQVRHQRSSLSDGSNSEVNSERDLN